MCADARSLDSCYRLFITDTQDRRKWRKRKTQTQREPKDTFSRTVQILDFIFLFLLFTSCIICRSFIVWTHNFRLVLWWNILCIKAHTLFSKWRKYLFNMYIVHPFNLFALKKTRCPALIPNKKQRIVESLKTYFALIRPRFQIVPTVKLSKLWRFHCGTWNDHFCPMFIHHNITHPEKKARKRCVA